MNVARFGCSTAAQTVEWRPRHCALPACRRRFGTAGRDRGTHLTGHPAGECWSSSTWGVPGLRRPSEPLRVRDRTHLHRRLDEMTAALGSARSCDSPASIFPPSTRTKAGGILSGGAAFSRRRVTFSR